MDLLNQAKQYIPQAEKFLQSENGQKLEDQFEQKTGIDLEKYMPSSGSGQQASGGNNARPSSDGGDNQNADGNYQQYEHDSTSEGGYGGDPFSRANQMGGSNSGSEGQFGRPAPDQADTQSYGTDGSRSGAGSEYGGSQPGSSGFEMSTGGGSEGYEGEGSNGRNSSFRGQSSDNVGA